MKQDAVPFLQAHFLPSVGAQHSFLNDTTNQIFFEETDFGLMLHVVNISHLEELNGQGSVLCVKWLFCWCGAVAGKEIMGKTVESEFLFENTVLLFPAF